MTCRRVVRYAWLIPVSALLAGCGAHRCACMTRFFDPLGDEPDTKPRLVLGSAKPCAIRVARTITIDGEPLNRANAVARCKASGIALVELGAIADKTEWLGLYAALDDAGVTVLLRNADASCDGNPLARGCR
jgi:hypothetical protein